MLSKTLANARLFHLRAAYALHLTQPSKSTVTAQSRLFSSSEKQSDDSLSEYSSSEEHLEEAPKRQFNMNEAYDGGPHHRGNAQSQNSFAAQPITTTEEFNEVLNSALRVVRAPLNKFKVDQAREFDPKIISCLDQGLYDSESIEKLCVYFKQSDSILYRRAPPIFGNLVRKQLSDASFDPSIHEKSMGEIINLLSVLRKQTPLGQELCALITNKLKEPEVKMKPHQIIPFLK